MIKIRYAKDKPPSKWIEIEKNNYPDNSLFLKLPIPKNSSCDILWNYENDSELFTLICLTKFLNVNELHLPYVPHARMDRVKTAYDVFSLKAFADILNGLNFKKVLCLDVHSDISLAVIDRLENIDITKYHSGQCILSHYNPSSDIIFYPDEGAMKRYSGKLKLPYAFGIKNRDFATGEITSLSLVNEELVNGKNILIIDDICSKGTTFLKSAEKLKECGAKDIRLFVTHCEKTIHEGQLESSGLIKQVYTTDSIYFDLSNKFVDVFPLNLESREWRNKND